MTSIGDGPSGLKVQRGFTQDDDAGIKFLVERGDSVEWIAQTLVPPRTVEQVARRIAWLYRDDLSARGQGAVNRHNAWTLEDRKRLMQLVKGGYTFQEIGQELGRTPIAVEARYLKITDPKGYQRFVEENFR